MPVSREERERGTEEFWTCFGGVFRRLDAEVQSDAASSLELEQTDQKKW